MLRWFTSFSEFAEFTEILFYLGNGVFPKWLSLNSVKSVNHDQIHLATNYITNASDLKCIFITTPG